MKRIIIEIYKYILPNNVAIMRMSLTNVNSFRVLRVR